MILIAIVNGDYKPTYNWGAPPCGYTYSGMDENKATTTEGPFMYQPIELGVGLNGPGSPIFHIPSGHQTWQSKIPDFKYIPAHMRSMMLEFLPYLP